MTVSLSHVSAMDFWRIAYQSDRVPGEPARIASLPTNPLRLRELHDALPPWAGEVLAPESGHVHTLVADAGKRCAANRVHSHVWSRPIPKRAFYRYSDRLLIASPEFTFLQLASTCNLPQLIAYADELCGRFAFDQRQERGIRSRTAPLTSIPKLQAFLEAAESAPASKRAGLALRYAAENAESPMEVAIHLLLSLPYRYGGYGIDNLKFNVTINLTKDASLIARRDSCRADLLLADKKIDIEFDGRIDHTGTKALDSDRRRTNALAMMGYEIIELTSEQVHDWAAFEQIALRIAKASGKRIERKYRGPLPARLALRNTLFNWNRQCGRPR